jgi:hypothetical protein
VKVDTTGGNVRVNLPDVNYPIDVIKTSSDAYIVTIWVGGTQIGEVAGELSSITVESGQVTKDEPWYPYDAIVGIAGVSGDGGEVLAKNKYGRVIAGGRGVAGTDDATVINSALASYNTILLSDCEFQLPVSLLYKSSNRIVGLNQRSTVLHPLSGIYAVMSKGIYGADISGFFRGCSIENLTIDGVAGSYGVDVENNVFFQASRIYAIHLDQAFTFKTTYGAIVDNCNIGSCGQLSTTRPVIWAGTEGSGISVNIRISHSSIEASKYTAVFAESSKADVSIYNTYFENPSVDIPGIVFTSKCRLIDCDLYYDGYVSCGPYNIIRGNLFQGSPGYAIDVSYSGAQYPCKITENTIQGGHDGIKAVSGDVVYGNFINYIDQNGIYLNGSNITCSNNLVQSAGRQHPGGGIVVAAAYNTIDGNIIRSQVSGYDLIVSANNIVFRDNSFSGGISLGSTSGHRWYDNRGYVTSLSGSSTGTGSEQTIAHGLAAAPSKAYIYIPSTGEMVGVASDATNIYPNVPSSIAYYWHAEV